MTPAMDWNRHRTRALLLAASLRPTVAVDARDLEGATGVVKVEMVSRSLSDELVMMVIGWALRRGGWGRESFMFFLKRQTSVCSAATCENPAKCVMESHGCDWPIDMAREAGTAGAAGRGEETAGTAAATASPSSRVHRISRRGCVARRYRRQEDLSGLHENTSVSERCDSEQA